jgi:class 3 adenylate cyclase
MSRIKRSDQTESIPSVFVDVGTILYTDIVRIITFPSVAGPIEMLDLMRRHMDYSASIVEAHGGQVCQHAGSAIAAYWLEKQEGVHHAHRAFAAAQQMLSGLPGLLSQQRGAQYDIRVTLGTGELAGEFFGPIKQFQVVGKARAVADRLDRAPASAGSFVRMSQYTADHVECSEKLVERGHIAREGLVDLRILEWPGGR